MILSSFILFCPSLVRYQTSGHERNLVNVEAIASLSVINSLYLNLALSLSGTGSQITAVFIAILFLILSLVAGIIILMISPGLSLDCRLGKDAVDVPFFTCLISLICGFFARVENTAFFAKSSFLRLESQTFSMRIFDRVSPSFTV